MLLSISSLAPSGLKQPLPGAAQFTQADGSPGHPVFEHRVVETGDFYTYTKTPVLAVESINRLTGAVTRWPNGGRE